MYKIEPKPAKHRIEMTFDSYQDHDAEKFMADLKRAALSVQSEDGHFDILADFSSSIVMPQHIAKDSEEIASWFVSNGMRKSANVIASTTQRMQIRRVTENDERFGYFEDRFKAESWLEA